VTYLSGEFGDTDTLDLQGEVVLAGEVRSFVRHLPSVQTDNEKLAERVAKLFGVKAPRPERLPEHVKSGPVSSDVIMNTMYYNHSLLPAMPSVGERTPILG
jgi:hypothetical protein